MRDPLTQAPSTPIIPSGPLSSRCKAEGLATFRDVCQFVRDLPYGTLTSKDHWANTVDEKIGTSSTKHAFLKGLADELGIPLQLMLGIYSMTEQNTPGVGVILTKHRLQSIPESHCYLLYNGKRLDFTRNYFDNDFMEPILSFIYEEPIEATNASAYKKSLHQRIIKEKFGESRFEHIWEIRNNCIAALEN